MTKIKNYYLENPLRRRARRHEEDKAKNPERHSMTQDTYTRDEIVNLCIFCTEVDNKNYEYDPKLDLWVRKE